ncbi:anthranilate phosphoribosyltransferase [Effusibacillus lacus]|uniref:Anthranilate phosphoribosyltransferase n=1 Tax=Effusibacillus lacus TaxID=1348429 RepID=A0A292YMN8_9BACL|nr:anthranilate phosphoribosyltransferase [Effusibacillus lacus]TCS75304.1 anthranilate phosphoribosyltransferase [Effusibacillus lacus]GAX89740.1 anthranilate phosphoribosyltransferase [Effusibacillus lacus]
MKEILAKLIEGTDLTEAEAEQVMDQIMGGQATHAQIAGFLTAMRTKGETVEEITGLVRSMRRHATPVLTDFQTVIDTCGTGGSGIPKFNVSTAAAFVTASAGVPIAKHGNRAMSGKSGSADVLQALKVNIELTPQQAFTCLKEAGICFMFAPLYHQSMKHAVGPRRELGFKTVFNILGPLTNPAGAKRQVIGTFSPSLPEKMARVLQRLGAEHVLVVHGSDGLDEITVTGPTQVAELKEGKIQLFEIHPEEFGLKVYSPEQIAGGTPDVNADILRGVLNGRRGAARDIVVINAAASLYVAGRADSLKQGVELAQELIDSGKARATLERLIDVSNRFVKELA